jgi:biopolymer transport protein TolR
MSAGGGQYELNLTPYIDLMSTLIVFLLMTAVWNQIAVLSSDTGGTTASDSPSPPDQNKVTLSVTILKDQMEMAENANAVKIPHVGDQIDAMRMVAILNQWRERYPKKTDVVLNTENSVSYKMLIKAFDTLVGNSFPDVGVSTQ